jgi:hypothetical protein
VTDRLDAILALVFLPFAGVTAVFGAVVAMEQWMISDARVSARTPEARSVRSAGRHARRPAVVGARPDDTGEPTDLTVLDRELATVAEGADR